jgi:hypothetical protein
MNSTNPQQAEVWSNSLCRDLGHEWKKAAVSTYRICQRDKCRAAERWQDGQWRNVLSTRTRQQHAVPEQSSLF